MKNLANCPLFENIREEDIQSMLSCFGAERIFAEKESFVFMEGDPAGKIGLIVKGSVKILRDDINGSRTLIGVAEDGDLFAEAFALASLPSMPVSVQAAEDTELYLLPVDKLLTPCSDACSFHHAVIRNLLKIVSRKNIQMNRKLRIISHKTTRGKLLAYLGDQARRSGSRSFTIPLQRQDLADYLGVDRSAMSAEIGKLVKEGVLVTKKNRFELL